MEPIKPNTPPSPPQKAANAPVPSMDEAGLRAIIKGVAEEMLAVSVATAQAMQPTQVVQAPPQRGIVTGPICGTCGQAEKACGREHKDIAVYPTSYPEFGEWFQGVFINGVKYLSNNESHLIPVPKVAVTTFYELIRRFEQNERESRVGRSKTHQSGHISNPTPAQAAWR
jgi:hypothetical protein